MGSGVATSWATSAGAEALLLRSPGPSISRGAVRPSPRKNALSSSGVGRLGTLAVRQRGQDPALIDHAWRVQRRLNARWNLLRNARGKPAGIVTIAIARELVGACWEIATAP
jgi:hypothetical protein